MAGNKWAQFKRDDGVLVRHVGETDLESLSDQVRGWLSDKGFVVEVLRPAAGGAILQAQEPANWKTAIGAKAPLEVALLPDAYGTRVDVRIAKVGGSVWAARLLTYSWVAMGISFLPLKKELENYVQDIVVGPASSASDDPFTFAGLWETHRSEYALGSEERRVDNAGNSSAVTRTIKATKTWSQECHIEQERTRLSSGGAEVKLFNMATLTKKAEATVRQKYSVTTNNEQTFEEFISLEVPAFRSMVLRMDWKKIIQHGTIRYADPVGHLVEMPFAVDVNLTFDQRQTDFGRAAS